MTEEKPETEAKAQPVLVQQSAAPEPQDAAPEKPIEPKIQDETQDTTKSQEPMNKDASQGEPPAVEKGEKVSGDAIKQSSSSKSISATAVTQSQHQASSTFIRWANIFSFFPVLTTTRLDVELRLVTASWYY